jgi:hypothetical protein
LDKASSLGPWTAEFLSLIDKHPGVRATELAAAIGWETEKLKLNVRKLKNLGLTISLGTGYRISPRGKTVMNRLNLKLRVWNVAESKSIQWTIVANAHLRLEKLFYYSGKKMEPKWLQICLFL